MKVSTEFNHFDIVYLIPDADQFQRMVIEIKILPSNLVVYVCSCNGEFSEHYEEELTKDKGVI